MTISSTAARQDWDAMISAASNGDNVIIEVGGKPKAVVISPETYAELQQARKQQRREQAMQMLREIEARYDGRNDDLTEAEIEEIAVRAGREINRAVADRARNGARHTE